MLLGYLWDMICNEDSSMMSADGTEVEFEWWDECEIESGNPRPMVNTQFLYLGVRVYLQNNYHEKFRWNDIWWWEGWFGVGPHHLHPTKYGI